MTMQEAIPPIIVEELFDAPKSAIWNAITDPKEMVLWYFENIEAFLPEKGFQTEFKVESGDRTFTHQWRVTDVKTKQKITYDWKYAEYPGDAYVSWELIDKGTKTLLRLTCVGIESFPSEIPEFTRESCHAGWKYFIQGRLQDYMDKTS